MENAPSQKLWRCFSDRDTPLRASPNDEENWSVSMSFIQAFSSLELKKLVRRYQAGDFLFQQGQMGQTMFIILEGKIALVGERDGVEQTVMSLGAGEFLGEKALTKGSPYQRVYGARAEVTSTAVEIGLLDIESIRKSNPAGMVDILSRVFQLSITRLEKMNSLCRALRSSDNDQRLRDLILFFSRTSSRTLPDGKREFYLSTESIEYHIDLDPASIQSALEALIRAGALERAGNNLYILVDEGLLLHPEPKAA